MNIEAYFNSKESYLKKEELLFTVIDELNRESFNVFSEVVNLSDTSYYKYTLLYKRITKLNSLYKIVADNYDKIMGIEVSSYDYAKKRSILKRFLTTMTIINLSFVNLGLGILGYVVLNNMINKDFILETDEIDRRLGLFDEAKLNETKVTLDNSMRLLISKLGKIIDNINSSDSSEVLNIICANRIIRAYLEGSIELDNVSLSPDCVREIIIHILEQDLGLSSDNIQELLEIAKNKELKPLKLIKKYES